MKKNTDRVLGRILAVEETHAVSGARPTSPSADNGSFPPTDTGYVYDVIPVDAQEAATPSFHARSI